ncbi:hypothetical protein RRG08_036454 [Elysia crispata]|uniref:Uncharacterized protein n=1 Tax=Elysia crispata TaxID=231223 RepID=A0AAE0ZK10_9GAST|nr:hypothetical protein RRG08_036454 [Elysia crispata]
MILNTSTSHLPVAGVCPEFKYANRIGQEQVWRVVLEQETEATSIWTHYDRALTSGKLLEKSGTQTNYFILSNITTQLTGTPSRPFTFLSFPISSRAVPQSSQIQTRIAKNFKRYIDRLGSSQRFDWLIGRGQLRAMGIMPRAGAQVRPDTHAKFETVEAGDV